MGVIFLFIDGIGLGKNVENNPLLDPKWDSFEELTNGNGLKANTRVSNDTLYFRPVDATLGVAGLPQSGTGQAALFSGKNAAKIAGKHFGPFPHSKTRHLLEEESLFHKLKQKGYNPHFINAYPEVFFEKMSRRNRWTCTTLMASAAGQKLNGIRELKEGHSITAEIVQDSWREQLNLDVKKITPETAAERIVKALERYDMVMYEYYLTDKAGHSMNLEMSKIILTRLNLFVREILRLKSDQDYLVISSDHGNMEDLSIKTHTRNPVPFIIHGKEAGRIENAQTIMDVPARIIGLF